MNKINPPNLYKLFVVLILATLFLPIDVQINFPYSLIGAILFLFGSYMAVKSKLLFKQTETPMSPFAKPVKLHQEGFFKYSRNPMYLGIAIGLLGLGTLTGYIFNIVYPILYIIICDVLFVRIEEKKLQEIFDIEFEEYKLKTRRWL